MKHNTVTALVLTVSEEETGSYAKSIFVGIFGLQGPMDCEVVLIRGEKENFKSC